MCLKQTVGVFKRLHFVSFCPHFSSTLAHEYRYRTDDTQRGGMVETRGDGDVCCTPAFSFSCDKESRHRQNQPHFYLFPLNPGLLSTARDVDSSGGPVHADDVGGARGSGAAGEVETPRTRRHFQPTSFPDEQHRLHGDDVEPCQEGDGVRSKLID